MEGCRQQLIEDAGIDPVPVGGDLRWCDPGPAHRSGEEPPCGLSVRPWREEDVGDLAELVDGPEQVTPGPSDLEVGLIDEPAIPDDVLTGPSRLRELGREPLDPVGLQKPDPITPPPSRTRG